MMRKWIVVLWFVLTACGGQAAPTAAPTANVAASPSASVAPALPQAAPATPTTIAQAVAPTIAPTAVNALSEYTSADGERVLGRPDAPVTMLDYSDFQ